MAEQPETKRETERTRIALDSTFVDVGLPHASVEVCYHETVLDSSYYQCRLCVDVNLHWASVHMAPPPGGRASNYATSPRAFMRVSDESDWKVSKEGLVTIKARPSMAQNAFGEWILSSTQDDDQPLEPIPLRWNQGIHSDGRRGVTVESVNSTTRNLRVEERFEGIYEWFAPTLASVTTWDSSKGDWTTLQWWEYIGTAAEYGVRLDAFLDTLPREWWPLFGVLTYRHPKPLGWVRAFTGEYLSYEQAVRNALYTFHAPVCGEHHLVATAQYRKNRFTHWRCAGNGGHALNGVASMIRPPSTRKRSDVDTWEAVGPITDAMMRETMAHPSDSHGPTIGDSATRRDVNA